MIRQYEAVRLLQLVDGIRYDIDRIETALKANNDDIVKVIKEAASAIEAMGYELNSLVHDWPSDHFENKA